MKRRGYTILELVISITLIGLIFSLSILHFSKNNIEFEKTVFQIKSDMRTVGIRSTNRYSNYKIRFSENGYTIYNGKKKEKEVFFNKNICIYSSFSKAEYRNRLRVGAPDKGFSVYVVDNKIKRAERITVIFGSGRVHSYSRDYDKIYDR